LAALTRPTGLILVLPLLWEYARQHGWLNVELWASGAWRLRVRLRELAIGAFTIGAAPAAVLLYMAYLWSRYKHPLIFFHVESWYWHHQSQPIWWTIPQAIIQFFQAPPWTYWQARQAIDLIPWLVFAILTVVSVRRMPFAFTLYMAGLLYLSVANPITVSAYPSLHLLDSVGRYLFAAVPMFLLLGKWASRRPWLELLLVMGGFMIQAVLLTAFLLGGWLI
jgi:hypothetical protein